MTQPIRTEIPGLFVLPLPTPFPIGRVNAYLAQGEALTLIDTGVNSPQSYDALRAGLAALGATPADLDRIIVTHHHTDACPMLSGPPRRAIACRSGAGMCGGRAARRRRCWT